MGKDDITYGTGETAPFLSAIVGHEPNVSASRDGSTAWGPTKEEAEKNLQEMEKND